MKSTYLKFGIGFQVESIFLFYVFGVTEHEDSHEENETKNNTACDACYCTHIQATIILQHYLRAVMQAIFIERKTSVCAMIGTAFIRICLDIAHSLKAKVFKYLTINIVERSNEYLQSGIQLSKFFINFHILLIYL